MHSLLILNLRLLSFLEKGNFMLFYVYLNSFMNRYNWVNVHIHPLFMHIGITILYSKDICQSAVMIALSKEEIEIYFECFFKFTT